jgi:hypothetical protein
MSTPKSVIDLLRDQPDEVLAEMETALEAKLASTQLELSQVRQARSRRGKRPSNRPATGSRHLSGVTRKDIFKLIEGAGRPMTAPEVREAFEERGLHASTNAVRNSLLRLVDKDGLLERVADGLYGLAKPDSEVSGNGVGSPLSREPNVQSRD